MSARGWRSDAACLGTDPELFFPPGSTGGGLPGAGRRGNRCVQAVPGGHRVPRRIRHIKHNPATGVVRSGKSGIPAEISGVSPGFHSPRRSPG